MPWMWVTQADELVCAEYCEPLHGVIFENQEDAPYQPGDAHPNCRCVWQYVPPLEMPDAKTLTSTAGLLLLPFWGDSENKEQTEPPVDIYAEEPLDEQERAALYRWLTNWSS